MNDPNGLPYKMDAAEDLELPLFTTSAKVSSSLKLG